MLSRHAENLFWTGRLVERAGQTARMLDVTWHALLESPHIEARRAWLDLLEVLQLEEAFRTANDHVSAETVSRFLVLAPDNAGGIVPSVARARENARSVRELLSTELWEAVNTFWLELQRRDLEHDLQHQPYELYRLVKRRCQEVAGTAADTIAHDDGWRFLTLGGTIERAQLVCRLLDVWVARSVTGDGELGFYQAVEILKSAAALEAFRKTYPGAMTVSNVVSFLLLSPTFPRSILYSVRSAEGRLQQLQTTTRPSRAQRVIGRLRADLEFADVSELLTSGLGSALGRVHDDLRGVAELVGVQFFRNTEELSVLHAIEGVG